MLGGAPLSERLRGGHDGHGPPVEGEAPSERRPGPDVALGAATQIEIEAGEVAFLVPFQGQWPNEYWLLAFRNAHDDVRGSVSGEGFEDGCESAQIDLHWR